MSTSKSTYNLRLLKKTTGQKEDLKVAFASFHVTCRCINLLQKRLTVWLLSIISICRVWRGFTATFIVYCFMVSDL